MDVLAGSTDVTTYFVLRLAATGDEATGLTITNFDLQYTRSGAAPAAKVDATALAATDSAHGDNQAIEIDATDQPGLYRVDWPDAAFAAGVREVILTVKCATAFTEHLRVNLTPTPVDVRQLLGTAWLTPGTAGTPDVNAKQISASGPAADNLELMFAGPNFVAGNVDDAGAAAGDFDGNGGLSSTDDFYNDCALVFTSGTLKGLVRRITDYVGSSRNLSFTTAFPSAPANSDTFIILGRIE